MVPLKMLGNADGQVMAWQSATRFPLKYAVVDMHLKKLDQA